MKKNDTTLCLHEVCLLMGKTDDNTTKCNLNYVGQIVIDGEKGDWVCLTCVCIYVCAHTFKIG